MAEASSRAEVIHGRLRTISVEPQGVVLRVDAAMIEFKVVAELVSSNNNALRRFHYFFEVVFSDGTGDDGVTVLADFIWPEEIVYFTEDGLEIIQPFEWPEEIVVFAEEELRAAWAIPSQEFVTFADYAVAYSIASAATESFTFSDISVAWTGYNTRFDLSVTLDEAFNETAFNAVAKAEVFLITDSLIADDGGGILITIALGEAFFIEEAIYPLPTAPAMYENFYITDSVKIAEVGTTDARPGAFVPGAALLGSPL